MTGSHIKKAKRNGNLDRFRLTHAVRADVDDASVRLQFRHQLTCQPQSEIATLRIDRFFKANGSLRAKVVARCSPAQTDRLEVRDLKDDILRLGKNRVPRSAHDAR